MHEVCVYDGGSLRLNTYYTLQSMVDEFLHVKDCYTGVVQLSGVTRAFVQESYVGGRVMMAFNEMQRVIGKKIADYDGVSLFPSAMAELPGFPIGETTDLTEAQRNRAFLDTTDWYAVEITVTKVGIERAFPVVSRMDGERRLWTNDMVGHKLIVDKCTLEDAITFHRVTSSW